MQIFGVPMLHRVVVVVEDQLVCNRAISPGRCVDVNVRKILREDSAACGEKDSKAGVVGRFCATGLAILIRGIESCSRCTQYIEVCCPLVVAFVGPSE